MWYLIALGILLWFLASFPIGVFVGQWLGRAATDAVVVERVRRPPALQRLSHEVGLEAAS
jgi:hypothetical protein